MNDSDIVGPNLFGFFFVCKLAVWPFVRIALPSLICHEDHEEGEEGRSSTITSNEGNEGHQGFAFCFLFFMFCGQEPDLIRYA